MVNAQNDLSILDSVKKVVGFPPEDESFDMDIIMHINTVFGILHQIGASPVDGFAIEDKDAKWKDVVGNVAHASMLKTFVALKVRMYLDPPTLSFVIDALKAQLAELEWRLSITEILWNPEAFKKYDKPTPILEVDS